MKSNSEKIFESESLKYFSRCYLTDEYIDHPPSRDFKDIISLKIKPNGLKILEVGCGSGVNLYYLKKNYDCICYGIEPNESLVNKLNKDYKSRNIDIKFLQGFSNNLEFEDNFFDLIICWSVLHWVDRNQILQSLGEILRVTKKYILLMDFCPFTPYKTNYHHQKNTYTYKTDYSDVLEKTGIVRKIDQLIYHHPNWDNTEELTELSFSKHASGKFDWVARKRILFEKDINLIPIKENFNFEIIQN